MRRHFLHQVSGALVKTHDRLVIEDLNVSGMLANHRLARAISDAGWAQFARVLGYKQAWRGGTSWSPTAGTLQQALPTMRGHPRRSEAGRSGVHLRLRTFRRPRLQSPQSTSPAGANSTTSTPGPPSNGAGPPTPADGTALTSTLRVPVKPARMTREPTFTPHPEPEPTTPENGGVEQLMKLFDTL